MLAYVIINNYCKTDSNLNLLKASPYDAQIFTRRALLKNHLQLYVAICICSYYRIAQFIDRGNIDGLQLALFRYLMGKILMDGIKTMYASH